MTKILYVHESVIKPIMYNSPIKYIEYHKIFVYVVCIKKFIKTARLRTELYIPNYWTKNFRLEQSELGLETTAMVKSQYWASPMET